MRCVELRLLGRAAISPIACIAGAGKCCDSSILLNLANPVPLSDVDLTVLPDGDRERMDERRIHGQASVP